ncbi:hypothetical protein [Streptomyces acidiscabies]|uniref:Uncharacterized protein n=1 Tax=Streptomyces acidiscabies TaxID=42234 RepID=A0AAP6EE69_9ACTN|nr:hypothetical protein [Streptomyces acidiscabies]MBP5939519.1 hypothetical protein [Streptomyces sp. LBUM 1476]MBZ3910671.1 hypothetical protein [Streptomyces acidiscabies]MDX2959672.1 hypothetical protein [Streptomyces acidiscabies]MDX3019040.1 hypothetical protein [Streptomyces acidiscabies]MDX3790879.1 hypothetical protein [Streptomyces acidiscabies]
MDPNLRLLPWTTPDGRPCYLSPDPSGNGHITQLADDIEAMQMDTAVEVLGHAKVVLDDPDSAPREVRFAGKRLVECLRDTVRVAESRGRRIEVGDEDDDDAPLDPK